MLRDEELLQPNDDCGGGDDREVRGSDGYGNVDGGVAGDWRVAMVSVHDEDVVMNEGW